MRGDNKIKYLPAVICLFMVLICVFILRTTGFEEIIEMTEDEPALALGLLWFLYAIKSMSVIFPATLLFIAAGNIFSFPAAVGVNIMGLIISFTLPYYIGKFSGSDAVKFITDKYPKAQRLVRLGQKNNFLTVYISRAVTVVPNDLMSMLHGALRMPFVTFILGSLMGVLPEMLVETYIGGQLRDLTWKSVLAMVGLILLTCVFSLLLNKRLSRFGIETECECEVGVEQGDF
ncbi:Uncharacterized membrane protein YdjX, TVP38/TMEM64 family, SNARE-associated domain [Ruminococcus sp. YE71]|uniref:TVP38/TMEM64 family protein n=1 Tax=unclassified Ruminococcus TaxID=2608920 RepID=UPI00088C39F7|nr:MULTISPECIES: VTT domain-containing protein [unclassified Ruminococcus]SDA11791.1 Uncharacterized membrane protein YdjX, TVP38/TMEM64 family, SNARE-associated domain [Ruminococcus sp. YE78]SFW15751.1 Uncharacterized membrane protein YdjX, TVP38/TMEM64 family, SNARE-associated domain [Ruminococcus sp. YE71]